MFKATSNKIFSIQICSIILSAIGIYVYGLGIEEIATFFIFYFLFCGVGLSMMLHRFYAHKSFTFKSPIVEKLYILIMILAGRGSPIGWVYVHREHHAYSDTSKDPHKADTLLMLLPHVTKVKNINLRVVRDLLDKENIFIDKWYLLFHIIFVSILTIINPWLTVFVWALPVCLTATMLDLSTYGNHVENLPLSYRNFETKEYSRNSLMFGYLMFGEGWHNNHHAKASASSFKRKWWEFDPVGSIIKIV